MSSRNLLHTVMRTTTRVAGYGLIGIGGVLAISPIPTGVVLMGIGAAMLIPTDGRFRGWLRHRRLQWSWLDSSLNKIAEHTPGRYGRHLKR